jgi:hypothetical protein
MSEYSPRLFVACKQESCTIFVAASRRCSGPVRKACWCGRNGRPSSSESSRDPWMWISLEQTRVGMLVVGLLRSSSTQRKRNKMSESSLPFHVHGDECVDEMGGVQSRKMRSYGFFQSSLLFFPVLFLHLERNSRMIIARRTGGSCLQHIGRGRPYGNLPAAGAWIGGWRLTCNHCWLVCSSCVAAVRR